jgi:hypothetical protein
VTITVYTVNTNKSPNQSIENTAKAESVSPKLKRKFRQKKYLTSDDVKQTIAGVNTSINNNDVEFVNLLDYVEQDSEILLARSNSKPSLRVN